MEVLMVAALVFLVIIVLIAIWVAMTYNGFVAMRNAVRNAWSQIDVQLKRRHDLIPNLVETVKGYAGHEKETLENVTRARSQAVSAQGVGQQAQAEQQLTGALGRLMLVVEQYPDLKANQNFWPCRKSSPRQRTRSPSRDSFTTTRSCCSTPGLKACRRTSLQACSISSKKSSSNYKTRRRAKPPESRSRPRPEQQAGES